MNTPNVDQENDMVVPIRSTIISSIFMLALFFSIPIYLTMVNFWLCIIIFKLWTLVPMFLVTFFCVKHTNSKKVNVQPPQGLQYHENFEMADQN